MKNDHQSGRSGRRRLVAPVAITALGVAMASAAWACTPATRDDKTKIQQCSAPNNSTTNPNNKVCKPLLGTPPFPDATQVKGPAGSALIAYTESGGAPGTPFDLMFVSSAQLANGVACFQDPSTKIGGPTVANANGGVPATSGIIPTNAPLGGGQVCFSDTATHSLRSSIPAGFKVII